MNETDDKQQPFLELCLLVVFLHFLHRLPLHDVYIFCVFTFSFLLRSAILRVVRAAGNNNSHHKNQQTNRMTLI